MKNKGFTLVELLIVIVILGVLSSFVTGNFLNSLKKGRDTKRKGDLQQLQKAFELYYEDTRTYPALSGNKIPTTNAPLCYSDDCSTKYYMQQMPTDVNTNYYYYYVSDKKTYYKIYSCIENADDNGTNVKQAGYDNTNCGCGKCKFGVSSSNVAL